MNFLLKLLLIFFVFACSSKITVRQPYQKTLVDLKVFFDTYNNDLYALVSETNKPKESQKYVSVEEIKSAEGLQEQLKVRDMRKFRIAGSFVYSEYKNRDPYWFMTTSRPFSKMLEVGSKNVKITIKSAGKKKSKIIIDARYQKGQFFSDKDYQFQSEWTQKIYNFMRIR